jgi:ABC-2 type transport system permease protein
MRVIDLAVKDIVQMFRDWKTGFFLVAMPVLFTLLMGFVFSDAGDGGDTRLPVGFVDRDGGVLGAPLLDLLEMSETIRPVIAKDAKVEDLEEQVAAAELAAVIVVPAGYSQQVLDGEPVPLTVIADPASNAGSVAQSSAEAAATRLLGAVQTAQLGVEAYQARAEFVDQAARQQFFEQALAQAVAAWETPPLSVETAESGAVEEEEAPSGFAHTSPGMMVQFSIAGLFGFAEILVFERKSRALQRLLTTPTTRIQILLGHFLAIFVLLLMQFVILVGFGQLALGLDYFREPVATLLMIFTSVLWTASFGLLIGVLAKSEEQAIIFSLIPMFILSALGGAWMPLETTGELFRTVGHLTPTAWSMDGFKDILVRGQGLESVWVSAVILVGWAVVLFSLAVWRFRFETR